MNVLFILHFTLLILPFILIVLFYHNYKLPKLFITTLLLIYYFIPIIWIFNKDKCPLTEYEKTNENKEIYKKFPNAPFLPLHFNTFLAYTFDLLNISYNNENVHKLIVGWNVVDFIIILFISFYNNQK